MNLRGHHAKGHKRIHHLLLAQGNREDLSNAIYNIDPLPTLRSVSDIRRRNVKKTAPSTGRLKTCPPST